MSTQRNLLSHSPQRASHWRPSIHSLAAAAAGAGELMPLLGLESYAVHESPPQRQDEVARAHQGQR
jgi:hypothetical protein